MTKIQHCYLSIVLLIILLLLLSWYIIFWWVYLGLIVLWITFCFNPAVYHFWNLMHFTNLFNLNVYLFFFFFQKRKDYCLFSINSLSYSIDFSCRQFLSLPPLPPIKLIPYFVIAWIDLQSQENYSLILLRLFYIWVAY